MSNKLKRIFAVAAVLVLAAFTTAPAQGETPTATAVTEATGIIHVIKKVVNDNNGTKVPSDFTLNLKHWGTDVEGSPFKGVDGEGTTFVLPPGTYVVMEAITDGYLGSWSSKDTANGFIDLQAGQEVTIIRTSDDIGIAPAVVEEPTEEGGLLPETSSPWFNLLAVGFILTLAGGLVMRVGSSVRKSE